MNDNEKRAHEIAIAALPALILGYQDRTKVLPSSISKEPNVYKFYEDVYESCLKEFSAKKAE